MLARINHRYPVPSSADGTFSPAGIREVLGIPGPRTDRFAESLPFSSDDVTAGSENELQVAVAGDRRNVDLPLIIEHSNYFRNIVRRVASGDTSARAVTDLEKFLENNLDGIWDNSWVRFPKTCLNSFAMQTLDRDLLADKARGDGPLRRDAAKFFCRQDGEELLRIPISYLLKLSLAQVIGSGSELPEVLARDANEYMEHFLSDNTSPETYSFHVVPLCPSTGLGRALAKEAAKRFLLCHLLVRYANHAFGLEAHGQKAMVHFSPHPPVLQKDLNNCISDSFYRELFMSPCLSGWSNGEKKHAYMHLCHQVLSRSRLNAVAKLREAGLITRNLVVLPNLSNVSLANNGTHISIGSLKLTRLRAAGNPGFTQAHEKCIGDLVIKIVEHFLPLFVGTYTAAPYRLDFCDFHPELALGFLPHQLDYTHLRMIWRRWKRKADLGFFGRSLTPFGPIGLDRALSALFRMRGDLVPDFRLIDYPVAMMSTDRSPALDGTQGSEDRLKKDLSDLGIFDLQMPLYLPYRLREFSRVGFSGFEGRHYSLFESLDNDMTHAANLQTLVTALAFKYALQGKWTHSHIADNPRTESERRQIFFGSAIGLPTFYVREDTDNLFLRDIVVRTRNVRFSRRYRGYVRVYGTQYCKSLVELLRRDAADLAEALGVTETIDDLKCRLDRPGTHSSAGKLTAGILDEIGARAPLRVAAREFNLAAERYYRTILCRKHVDEALQFLEAHVKAIDLRRKSDGEAWRAAISASFADQDMSSFVSEARHLLRTSRIVPQDVVKLIHLVLLSVHVDARNARETINGKEDYDQAAGSRGR
ncbi:MAG: hypothetical protein AB1646_22530 [Thermodesulfobacteriota bacterium]